MQIPTEWIAIALRAIALVTLFLGLSDASRLLGVSMGTTSPIDMMGMSAFIYLGVFTVAHLFAAVGIWIRANWGNVLLTGVTVLELGLYLSGSPNVQMSLFGFIVRLVILIAMLLVFLIAFRTRRAAIHD
ncbi:hypothetical protein [Paradevosia shaoguanensis]|uniref:DUF2127 domain-containing protein n=1 Tax=Paradevosia shaoguanensis TaxID=1335043 RepID=A0AA41UD01_9HYPH|nr:hypothetical protein [Paradevosia shaoguanensis]KFL26394.1 hypothetical protein JP74_13550 [Devosia sp. 17-2-E-8]MBI4045852.1 hypothetical protein [Devosia nanyangense]QMV02341.1 hypothetical protein GHV40_13005 [Devosia sp. D6-9]CDP54346.1 hypothetical protein [Devosia sp. DBB001]MCF1742281.1 hypothetical protein [Paradevosia shaoguanensis]